MRVQVVYIGFWWGKLRKNRHNGRQVEGSIRTNYEEIGQVGVDWIDLA
jgi:hypothetical protein